MGISDKIELFSAIATFLGVTVALVALCVQFYIMNQQLQIQQYADYTKRYQEIVIKFPENINQKDFSYDKLSVEDYRCVMRNMRAYFDLSFEEWHLNQRALLHRETWRVWKGGMKTAMGKTAFSEAWKKIKEDTEFGESFESFIDSLKVA
jgi:hypothetical protein